MFFSELRWWFDFFPTHSHRIHATGIFPYIYHKCMPNVGIYPIHGSYQIWKNMQSSNWIISNQFLTDFCRWKRSTSWNEGTRGDLGDLRNLMILTTPGGCHWNIYIYIIYILQLMWGHDLDMIWNAITLLKTTYLPDIYDLMMLLVDQWCIYLKMSKDFLSSTVTTWIHKKVG